MPVKEQCGVRDPYVREYGDNPRNFTLNDTCACTTSKGEGPLCAGVWREPQELQFEWYTTCACTTSKGEGPLLHLQEYGESPRNFTSQMWMPRLAGPYYSVYSVRLLGYYGDH